MAANGCDGGVPKGPSRVIPDQSKRAVPASLLRIASTVPPSTAICGRAHPETGSKRASHCGSPRPSGCVVTLGVKAWLTIQIEPSFPKDATGGPTGWRRSASCSGAVQPAESVKRWANYPGTGSPFIQNKGKPYLDGINWITILDAPQRAIQIQDGEIDTLRGPAFQDISRLQADKTLTVTQLKEWSGYFMTTNFGRTDLGFDDVNVRQALSHAIDRKGIVKALLFDHGTPLYGPITTADKSYTKDVEQFNQFDTGKASSLLGAAGWKAGSDGILRKNGVRFAFEMIIQSESFNQQLGSAIQAQMKAIGVDLKVTSLDRGTFFNKAFALPDSLMFFYLWPVPIDVVTLFVNSANANGKGPNWSNAVLPQMDQAVAAWQSAANESQLNAAGKQFQVVVAEQLPFIPIINRDAFWVNRQNVHGWHPDQWNLYPYYNDVWLG